MFDSLPEVEGSVAKSAADRSEKLLTIAASCEKLAVSRSHLYRLAKAGHLSIIKVGGSSRCAESDLDAFIVSLKEAA